MTTKTNKGKAVNGRRQGKAGEVAKEEREARREGVRRRATTEELHSLSAAAQLLKTTNQALCHSQRERIYHSLHKIRAGLRHPDVRKPSVRPPAGMFTRLIGPCRPWRPALPFGHTIHAPPRLLPPQSSHRQATADQPRRNRRLRRNSARSGLEQRHQHHPVSDVQTHRVGLSGPSSLVERYGCVAVISMAPFRGKRSLAAGEARCPSSTPAWIRDHRGVPIELRRLMQSWTTDTWPLLQGAGRMAWRPKSARPGGQPVLPPTTQAPAPGHRPRGGPALKTE